MFRHWVTHRFEVSGSAYRGLHMTRIQLQRILSRFVILGVLICCLFMLSSMSEQITIVRNNKTQASGVAQDRVYLVREGDALKSVISIENISNINLPEFPKGFQIKIKNISSKPIYYIY